MPSRYTFATIAGPLDMSAGVDRLTARLGEWDTKTLAEMAEQIERLCDSLATQPASPTGRKTHA